MVRIVVCMSLLLSLSIQAFNKPYLHTAFDKTWSSVNTISSTNQQILKALSEQTNLGDLVVVDRNDFMTISFEYGVQEYDIAQKVTESGRVYSEDSMGIVSTGEGRVSSASIQTKRTLPHVPGHDSYLFFTAKFSDPSDSSQQWIGMFDEHDGVALGFHNKRFSLLVRSNNEDSITSQEEFNIDKLDGLVESRLAINPSNLNLFRILMGSSKVSPIRFQVLDDDGTWITFHIINKANQVMHPLFLNSFLPIRAEVKKEEGIKDISLSTSSWSAGFVGKLTSEKRFFSQGSSKTLLDALGAETHVLTIRNKAKYMDKLNKIELRLQVVSGGSALTGNEVSIMRIRKNVDVMNAKYRDVNAYSVVEYNQDGSLGKNLGDELLAFPSTSRGSGPLTIFLGKENISILLLPGESITITGQSISGIGNSAFAIVGWEEQIY